MYNICFISRQSFMHHTYFSAPAPTSESFVFRAYRIYPVLYLKFSFNYPYTSNFSIPIGLSKWMNYSWLSKPPFRPFLVQRVGILSRYVCNYIRIHVHTLYIVTILYNNTYTLLTTYNHTIGFHPRCMRQARGTCASLHLCYWSHQSLDRRRKEMFFRQASRSSCQGLDFGRHSARRHCVGSIGQG